MSALTLPLPACSLDSSATFGVSQVGKGREVSKSDVPVVPISFKESGWKGLVQRFRALSIRLIEFFWPQKQVRMSRYKRAEASCEAQLKKVDTLFKQLSSGQKNLWAGAEKLVQVWGRFEGEFHEKKKAAALLQKPIEEGCVDWAKSKLRVEGLQESSRELFQDNGLAFVQSMKFAFLRQALRGKMGQEEIAAKLSQEVSVLRFFLEIGGYSEEDKEVQSEIRSMEVSALNEVEENNLKQEELPMAGKRELLLGPAPVEIDDQCLQGSLKRAGSGFFSTTYEGIFKVEGREFRGVWKKETSYSLRRPLVLSYVTISRKNPNNSSRNIAKWRLSQALGFSVMPRVYRAKLEGEEGIVMDYVEAIPRRVRSKWSLLVPGIPWESELLSSLSSIPEGYQKAYVQALGKRYGRELAYVRGHVYQANPDGRKEERRVVLDLSNPKLRRRLMEAQLINLITGELDSHMYNQRVQPSGEVKLIDGDFSCAPEPRHPAGLFEKRWLREKRPKDPYLHIVDLPKVVDKEMQMAIGALTPQRLRQMLNHLLTPKEVEGIINRFLIVQGHVRSEAMIIEQSQWGDEEKIAPLFDQGRYGSYLAREKGRPQTRFYSIPHELVDLSDSSQIS